MDGLALDASLSMAWCYPDEQTPYTDAVLNAVAVGSVYAPRLWAYEVRNSVLMGVRRKRITPDQAKEFMAFLAAAPVRLVDPPDFGPVYGLASRYDLTVYDAAYVELALREGLELATLDEAMRRAGLKAGVKLFGP